MPRRILVVDDSPANRAVLKAMLMKMGVADIELAEDGKDALEKLQKAPSIDLVLSDIWMPVIDGVELASRIRADARLKICAITADVEARAMRLAPPWCFSLLGCGVPPRLVVTQTTPSIVGFRGCA